MRTFIVILLLAGAIIIYLFYYNPETVRFRFGKAEVTTYIPFLMGLSFLAGILVAFVLQFFSTTAEWAKRTFERLRRGKERKALSLLSEAEGAFEAGDIPEAIRKAEESLRLKEDNPEAKIFMAKLKISTNSYQEAIEILRDEILKGSPPLKAVMLYLKLSMKEELPDAVEAGRKKVQEYPRNPYLLRAMARVCDRYHFHEEALEYQRKLLRIDGWDTEPERLFYAYLLLRNGEEKINEGNEDEGVRLMKKAIDEVPYFSPAVNFLVRREVKNGEVRRAVELAEETYRRRNSHSVILSLENALLNANLPANALEFYEKMNSKFNDPVLKYLEIKLLLNLEMLPQAEEGLKEVSEEIASSHPFRFLSLLLYLKKNGLTEASRGVEELAGDTCFYLWKCTVCRTRFPSYSPLCGVCESVDSMRMCLE